MTSPMVTVIVLAVLWAIVVVPMVMRRKDERAHERSVQRFTRSMSLLGSGRALSHRRVSDPADPGDATMVVLRTGPSQPEVFVSGQSPHSYPEPVRSKPVPAAKEAFMYPVERNEMSDARRRMLARRRRSLIALSAGTVLSIILVAMGVGGFLMDAVLVIFGLGLGGYLWFLRSQAQRDAARRASRLARAGAARRAVSHEAFEPAYLARYDDTIVALDDDDPQFDHLDTIDLTGLYHDIPEPLHQRRSA